MPNFQGEMPLITVNRSSVKCPDFFMSILKPKEPLLGPKTYQFDEIELWIHSTQKNGLTDGFTIVNHILDNRIMPDFLGLEDGLAIKKQCNPKIFLKIFGYKPVFLWRTIMKHENGDLYVSYLLYDGAHIKILYDTLSGDWDQNRPALRFTNSSGS